MLVLVAKSRAILCEATAAAAVASQQYRLFAFDFQGSCCLKVES